MDTKFADKLVELEQRLLDRPGKLEPSTRRAAARGGPLPEELTAYVEKVRHHAYNVTDEDVRRLLGAGWSEDQIFELTVATAYGAARRRLEVGLGALTGWGSGAGPADAGTTVKPTDRAT